MRPSPNLADALLTVASAREQGVDLWQFTSDQFVAVHRGVRIARRHAAALGDLHLLCDAACLVLPPAAVFSHYTALALNELPDPSFAKRRSSVAGPRPVVHVTVPPGTAQPRRRGVVGHVRALRPEDVVLLDGRRVTSPARTFVDLAERSTVAQLAVVGDAMLARELVSKADLLRAVAASSGRRGVAVAREAAPLLDGRSRSPMESITRVYLVKSGLSPEPNVDIYDDWGRLVGCPDLYLRAARLAVEYEGEHHRGKGQFDHDAARDRRYHEVGILPVRLTGQDVLRNPASFLDTIWRLHEERAPGVAKRQRWRPPSCW